MNSKSTSKVFAIQRPWEPGTAAIVAFSLESEAAFTARNAEKPTPYLSAEMQARFREAAEMRHFTVSFLKELVIAAVTAWVKNSPEGKQEWENASEDFNIGDLSGASESVSEFYAACGILSLDIETASADDSNWEFDNVLVDSSELEEADPEAVEA